MKREELIPALRRAASAFVDLLRRLETDGYLKSAEGSARIVSTVLHEMAAYAAAVSVRDGIPAESALESVMEVFLPEEERIEKRIREGVKRRMQEFAADPKEIPSCYEVLDRFDAMALEYESAFYERLGVPTPGHLTDRYMELLQGFGEVICLCRPVTDGDAAAVDETTKKGEAWIEAMERLKEIQSEAAL